MGTRIQQQVKIWRWRPSVISMVLSAMIVLLFALICSTVFVTLRRSIQNQDINWQSIAAPWWYSFSIASYTCLICLVLGLLVTWCLRHLNISLKAIDQILALPYCLPTVAVGGMTILTYGNAGLINQIMTYFHSDPLPMLYQDGSPLIGTVWMNLSFGVLLLLRAWQSIPSVQWQHADLMHFTKVMRLRHILVPALTKAILPWLSITFLACFNSFGLMLILSGSPSATTLELATWQSLFLEGDWNRAAILMTVQMLSAASLVTILWATTRSQVQETVENKISNYRHHRQSSLTPFAWLGVLLFLSFYLLPVIALILDVAKYVQSGSIHISDDLIHAMTRSGTNALIVALMSICFVLTLVPTLQKAAGFQHQGLKKWFSMVIGLPGIVPGMVCAFALLALLSNLETDNYKLPAIWLIQSIMAIPITAGIYWNGWKGHFSKHFRIKEELGLSPFFVWQKIEFPVMWKWAATSAAVAAGLSIGDSTVVSLLSDPGDPPLTLLIARLMGSYQFAEASLIVLVLILLTVILFLWASYPNKRNGT